jgi:hypothetical protein
MAVDMAVTMAAVTVDTAAQAVAPTTTVTVDSICKV